VPKVVDAYMTLTSPGRARYTPRHGEMAERLKALPC
jgi:hypothetical protein